MPSYTKLYVSTDPATAGSLQEQIATYERTRTNAKTALKTARGETARRPLRTTVANANARIALLRTQMPPVTVNEAAAVALLLDQVQECLAALEKAKTAFLQAITQDPTHALQYGAERMVIAQTEWHAYDLLQQRLRQVEPDTLTLVQFVEAYQYVNNLLRDEMLQKLIGCQSGNAFTNAIAHTQGRTLADMQSGEWRYLIVKAEYFAEQMALLGRTN